MALKFVDVASHQGNYTVGSNGEDGVIIKATQGAGYVNPYCDFVAQQAIKKNKPWGLYHYAGGGDPTVEADYFIKNISGYLNVANKPVLILDWESYQNNAYGNGAWAETFLKRLKDKTSVQGGIYGNSGDLSQMTQWVIDNAWVWFAGYPYAAGTTSMIQDWAYPNFPYNSGKFKTITGWQFSSQPLDKSVFYLEAKDWAKLANQDGNDQTNNDSTYTINYTPNMEEKEMTYLIYAKDTKRWYVTNGIEIRYIKTTRVLGNYQNQWLKFNLPVDTMFQAEVDKEFGTGATNPNRDISKG